MFWWPYLYNRSTTRLGFPSRPSYKHLGTIAPHAGHVPITDYSNRLGGLFRQAGVLAWVLSRQLIGEKTKPVLARIKTFYINDQNRRSIKTTYRETGVPESRYVKPRGPHGFTDHLWHRQHHQAKCQYVMQDFFQGEIRIDRSRQCGSVDKNKPGFHPHGIERFRQTVSHIRNVNRKVVSTSNGNALFVGDIYEG